MLCPEDSPDMRDHLENFGHSRPCSSISINLEFEFSLTSRILATEEILGSLLSSCLFESLNNTTLPSLVNNRIRNSIINQTGGLLDLWGQKL